MNSAAAQAQEKRIALVVGNGAYAKSPLATAANDAGLIAQTLQAAGFDVIGARDLDGDTLRKSFRDFIQKAESSGPDTVAMVYLAGYGAATRRRQLFRAGQFRRSTATPMFRSRRCGPATISVSSPRCR